jgi:hypothetical protein
MVFPLRRLFDLRHRLCAAGGSGVSAILIVAVRLDTVVAAAPVSSQVGGIVARPRGPPFLA